MAWRLDKSLGEFLFQIKSVSPIFYFPLALSPSLILNTRTHTLCLPEDNDFIRGLLPSLVLLQTDTTIILFRGQPSGDRGSQVAKGPVEIMV